MTTRHWGLGATLLAAAIVAVVVLPPRPIPEEYSFAASALGFSYRFWAGESEGYTEAVRRARDRYAEAIAARQHGAADVRASRGPLALSSSRERLVVVRDPDVPIGAAREWLRDAEVDLSFYPRGPNVGVPVILGLHTSGVFPGTRSHPHLLAGRLLYAEGRDTTCIVDVLLPHNEPQGSAKGFWSLRRGGWDGRRIGTCALYSRYGVPGPGVRAWYGLPAQWQWTDDGQLRWSLARREAGRRQIERYSEWGFQVPPEYLMCLDRRVACEEIFGLQQGRDGAQWSYRGETAVLIADLLESRGPDRFARFWRSGLPVDSALQAAYGVPIGTLGREALLRRLIPPQPSGAHRGAAATTVVWLAGLLGFAMLLSRRQTMGL